MLLLLLFLVQCRILMSYHPSRTVLEIIWLKIWNKWIPWYWSFLFLCMIKILWKYWAFPDSSVHLQCRRPLFDSWVRKFHWRRYRLPTPVFFGFPCGSAGKESTCNAGDPDFILGSGRSAGEGIGYPLQYSWASLEAQLVKSPAMWETWDQSLVWEDPLEKGKATHSSILA